MLRVRVEADLVVEPVVVVLTEDRQDDEGEVDDQRGEHLRLTHLTTFPDESKWPNDDPEFLLGTGGNWFILSITRWSFFR